jgi:hypothetical protein
MTVMCDTGMKYLRTYRTELSKGDITLDDASEK